MSFVRINYDQWERKEFLEYFQNTAIYMTALIDISTLYKEIKQRGLRLYPALVYCAAKVINQHPEFRYAYDDQQNVGIWDTLHPYYTVPRKNNHMLFSMKCTQLTFDFSAFYADFVRDYALAERCGRLLCDESLPKNICGISIVPGLQYSSFSFGGSPKMDFTPFTLFGKFEQQGESVRLPVSGEFSHAVNDGAHISLFFQELEKTANQLFSNL